MQRTPDQVIAIENHTQNLIVVAGAGSGKTYVLVERYLALLDAHPEWPLNALVAITFTKKAAQEMRDRVRRRLEERYHAALDTRTRDLWAERIAGMDSARIDTIHGLCASILRANAAEAGIDPGFEVLDEVQSRLILESAVDTALAKTISDDDPAAALLVEYETGAVRRAVMSLIAAEIDDPPPDVFERWSLSWEQGAAEAIGRLRDDPAFRAAADWMPEHGWPEDSGDRLFDVWAACWPLMETIDRGIDFAACIESVSRLVETVRLNVGSAANWGGKDALAQVKERLRKLREKAQETLKDMGNRPGDLDRRAAELLPLWASLIRRAQGVYHQTKRAASPAALDFDDLEHLTHALLRDHPAVRARYQAAEFKHLLVDEFQDTNAVQWEIVRALADPAQPGSLFIVGDPKQSIYQFRGADVSVFDHVRAEIIAAGGQSVALARSFRTHSRLVEGFNSLFRHILLRDPHSPVSRYQVELGQPMQAARLDAPFDAPEIECILVGGAELSREQASAEGLRRWEAYEVATHIQALIAEGRPVFDKHEGQLRPMRCDDVAILFQSTTSITLYEEVFKALRLPFVTIAGRGYYSRQEVWDLLNLLTALHNPADNLALATALRSPLFSLSDDALLALRLLRDEQGERLLLWDALNLESAHWVNVPEDEILLLEFARTVLRDLHDMAGRVTISELLAAILDRTGYLAALTGLPDGARRRGNVEKLLDKALSSGQVTLGAFQHYLRDLTAREVREGEATVDVTGAVTLMTVHASKGLEYPLVVLVDAGWSGGDRDRAPVRLSPEMGLCCRVYDPDAAEWVDTYAYARAGQLDSLRELAEDRRLLYVAMTRAQDYLLISARAPLDKDGALSKGAGWRRTTWLGWLWDSLALNEEAPRSEVKTYDWGQVAIIAPEVYPPDDAFALREPSAAPLWDNPSVQEGLPLPGNAAEPVLLREVVIDRSAYARHLTATQIADLGSDEPFHHDRFRRSVLHTAPAHVPIVSGRGGRVSPRLIGEIVHEVLGWGDIPADDRKRREILQNYAWQFGVVDSRQQKQAVQEADTLLRRTLQSEAYRWLAEARQVFRELLFIFRTEQRIIHGVLDVLFQRPDGSWVVLDYKTSTVHDYGNRGDEVVVYHARRYHLQVGVYAAAVREQLGGMMPDVYIHYIRHAVTVPIPAHEWEQSLDKLETCIGSLL